MDEMPLHSSMLIQWSDTDAAYVVTLSERADRVFRNPITHGDIYEDAVRNGQKALELLVAWATEQGYTLPTPRLFAHGGVRYEG